MMWDRHGPLFQWSDREKMILEALRFVRANKVEGDYYEFGVGEGYTLATAARISAKLGFKENMQILGFDSFKGLPKPEGLDLYGNFKEGDYAFTLDNVIQNFPKSELYRLGIFECWFGELETTCDRKYFKPAAVVWIDCDMYASTVPVFTWITPLLQSGTILCFDDWNCFKGSPFRGQKLAFNTWCTEHESEFIFSRFLPFGWHGMSFITMELG